MPGALLIFILFIIISEHQQFLDPHFFKQKLCCKNCFRFDFSINSRLIIDTLHNINFFRVFFINSNIYQSYQQILKCGNFLGLFNISNLFLLHINHIIHFINVNKLLLFK